MAMLHGSSHPRPFTAQRPCGGRVSAWRVAPAHGACRGAAAASRRQQGRSLTVVTRAAMFDNLSQSLQQAWKTLSSNATLTPENIKEPLRDVRRALLEADVSLSVVKSFIKRVEEKALGQQVIPGVNPQMALVKVVYDELTELMGSAGAKDLQPGKPQIVLMAGLQGVGKTTACGKLASLLTKQGKKVLLVATDVYRPAAIEQLQKLGQTLNVPVFEMGTSASPVDIARKGVEEGRKLKVDAIIIDTAGRLQVDTDLMNELRNVKSAVKPTDTLLVVDAMTGQEAANLVKTFDDEVKITGAIVTKMDGDARGGAALSISEVSGKPIKFMGVGEGMDNLEPFYPERMAQRVLGMGDVLTLYEKAASSMKQDDAERIMKRILDNKFDFNDFLSQYQAMNNMGGTKMMKLIPGFTQVSEKQLYEVDKKLKMFEAMIAAMDEEERTQPDILAKDLVRQRRVAAASGFLPTQVANMIAQFNLTRSQMLRLAKAMGPGMKTDPTALASAMSGASMPPATAAKDKSKEKKAKAKAANKGF